MRRRARRWAAGMMLATAAGGCWAAGCSKEAGDCERSLTCEKYRPGEGGGGGTPVGCTPSERDDAVGDECGVFVSVGGDDTAAGTKAAPLATLTAAITRAAAEGGRVYACAETFAEAVDVPAGVTIFGGLDCANGWGWVGEMQKTVVEGAADEIALWVRGGEGTARIEDVSVRAGDAVMAGGSSIAVMVDGAMAELVRCELTAGSGADGAVGAPGAEPDGMGQIPAGTAGMPGNPGVNACSDLDMSGMPDATLLGGAQAANDCGSGALSIGGTGGTGNVLNGDPGVAGQVGTDGQNGAGEPAAMANMWNCGVMPGDPNRGGGNAGSNGMPGMPGTGATGSGTLSSTGYAGVSGGAGTSGQPGQGGGGGGGAKGGNAICPGTVAGAGASGGSGGAGGCGGLPGQGGGPGGASIALASVNAQVTLTGSRLTAGNGGRGGAGGDFQPGGSGGQGGIGGTGVGGSKNACAGGQGGQGGNGGPGGGGLGGPSAGIAYVGAAVVKDAATTLVPGTPGDGGPGGNADLAMNSGAAGTAAEELELP